MQEKGGTSKNGGCRCKQKMKANALHLYWKSLKVGDMLSSILETYWGRGGDWEMTGCYKC